MKGDEVLVIFRLWLFSLYFYEGGVVWSDFAVAFLTLILFLSFSTDYDIFLSNIELHWSLTVFAVVFQALVDLSLNSLVASIYFWMHSRHFLLT